MVELDCPAENCDWSTDEKENQKAAKRSLRGHIRGKNNPVHREVDVADALDTDPDTPEEEGEDGDGDAVGDPGEVPGPNGETGHLGEGEVPDEAGSDTTDDDTDDYSEQWERVEADDPGPGEENEDNDQGDTDSDGGSFATTLLAGTAAVGIAVLALSGDDEESPTQETDSHSAENETPQTWNPTEDGGGEQGGMGTIE